MRSVTYCKVVLSTIIALTVACTFIAGASAATPVQPMSAHLWIEGLPQGELMVVTVDDHAQLNYVGGQGRYDFPINGQPGETIRIIAGGNEIQSFTYEPGAQAYLSLVYSNGTVAASTYNPGDPMPTPYANPVISGEPATEHTGLNLDGSWIAVLAIMMAIIVVGCFATIRRKNK